MPIPCYSPETVPSRAPVLPPSCLNDGARAGTVNKLLACSGGGCLTQMVPALKDFTLQMIGCSRGQTAP